jgi:hypothetical protein
VVQGNRDNTDVLLYYTTTGRPLIKNLQEHVVQGNRDPTDILLCYSIKGRPLLKNLQEHVVQGNRDNTDVLLYYTTTDRYRRNMWCRGTGTIQTSCSTTPIVADPDPGSGIGCLFDPWIRDPG